MDKKIVVTCSFRPKGFVKYYSFRKQRKMGRLMNILMQLRFARYIYKLLFKQEPGIINKNQRVYDSKLLAQQIANAKKRLPEIHFIGEQDHPIE
jgi:hypothetical protein